MLRGSAFHLFHESLSKGASLKKALKVAVAYIDRYLKENEEYHHPDEVADIHKVKSLVIGMCKGSYEVYKKRKAKVVGSEMHFRARVRDLEGDFSVYAGTLDQIVETPDYYYVGDFKTKGYTHAATSEWLRHDSQTLGYAWLLRSCLESGLFLQGKRYKKGKPVFGVQMNIIGITKIRHKQTQTYEEYLQELEDIYIEQQEKYFTSFFVPIEDKKLDAWEDDLYNEIKEIQARKKWKKNTNMCIQSYMCCEYLALCLDGMNRVNRNLYDQRPPSYWDPQISAEGDLLDV